MVDYKRIAQPKNIYLSKWLLSLPLFLMALACYLNQESVQPKFSFEQTKLVFSQKGAFGDGKFFDSQGKNYYLSSLDSQLSVLNIVDFEMRLVSLPIAADWLAVEGSLDGSAIVATSAFVDKRVRIYKIDPGNLNYTLLSHIGDANQIRIDPALTRANDSWLLTYTTVDGTVNNADLNQPNGHYEVHLHKSHDLIKWEKLPSIYATNRNLEDSRLYYLEDEKRLQFLFEDESLNLGASSIKLMTSNDMGVSWTEPESLIEDGNDNEPAGILRVGKRSFLFYSSDSNNPGKSYAGANAFYAEEASLNVNKPKLEQKMLGLADGILLIDTQISSSGKFFSAAIQDYLGDKKLMIFQGS